VLTAATAAVRPEDVCFVLYTSGSTATPKGVMLAHGGVIANGFDIGERQHLTAADRLWLAVPLFWSFGSANALPAILTHGGTLVLQESFEPGEALALLDGERCSVYYGMANMARALLEHPDRSRRPAGRDAHRAHDRIARGPPDDDRGGQRARAVQRVRRHRDLRQLRGDRRPRSARAAPDHAGASAARHAGPRGGPGDRPAAPGGRGR